jgi:hypothetical protein
MKELYPGYDPKIDPDPVTCWGYGDWVEELVERLRREQLALWHWVDEYESKGPPL